MLSAAALRLILGCAAHWKQRSPGLSFSRELALIKTLASAEAFGVLGSFTSRVLSFVENIA